MATWHLALGRLHGPQQRLPEIRSQRLPNTEDLQRWRGRWCLRWTQKCRYLALTFNIVLSWWAESLTAWYPPNYMFLTLYFNRFSCQMELSAILKSRPAQLLWSSRPRQISQSMSETVTQVLWVGFALTLSSAWINKTKWLSKMSTFCLCLIFDCMLCFLCLSCPGFFADGGSPAKAEFLKSASALRESFRFAHTNSEELLQKHGVEGEWVFSDHWLVHSCKGMVHSKYKHVFSTVGVR